MSVYGFIPAGYKEVNGKLVPIIESQATVDELRKLLNEARAEAEFFKAECARLEGVRVAILEAGVPGYIRRDRAALEGQINALQKEIELLKTPAPVPADESAEEDTPKKRKKG